MENRAGDRTFEISYMSQRVWPGMGGVHPWLFSPSHLSSAKVIATVTATTKA